MVVFVVRVINFAFTSKLNYRMPNLEFFTENTVNFFGKLRSLTNHHVFRINMAAHGIHTGSNCPNMNVMSIIDAGNLFEPGDNVINTDSLRCRF